MIRERILKSGRKSYLARARASDGTYYRKTFDKKRNAEAWLANQKIKRIGGDFITTPKKTTVTKFFSYYIRVITPRLEERSAWGYELDIKNHVVPILGEKRLIDITFDDGLLLQKSIMEKGLSNKTNNKVLSLFKQGLSLPALERESEENSIGIPLKVFPSLLLRIGKSNIGRAMRSWTFYQRYR